MLAREMVGRTGVKVKIERQCAVYPSHRETYMPILGMATIVRVWNGGPSPTGIPHELPIEYCNAQGEVERGWIESHATISRANNQTKPLNWIMWDPSGGLSALDLFRSNLFHSKWKAFRWLNKFGTNCPSRLRAVIRQLGGITHKSDDPHETINRLIRMLGLTEESTMAKQKQDADNTAQDTSAKKKGKKSTKQVTAKEKEGGRANSMRVSCGNALVPILTPGSARKTAKRLQADEAVSKKDLVALRDGVNEQASAAREAGDGKLASKLSAANRIVRRLARAAK